MAAEHEQARDRSRDTCDREAGASGTVRAAARHRGPGAESMRATSGDGLAGLARIVRVAIGRLGCVVAPWLDEGLMFSHGLTTLLELARTGPDQGFEAVAVRHVVDSLRRRARTSSWYRNAWGCRVAPLSAAAAGHGANNDAQIAAELGVPTRAVPERFVEAGLLFGVSPELMLSVTGDEQARQRRLAAAVCALPTGSRRLLTLYFGEGLSFPEIAHLLDLSHEAAQEFYGRAAARIRGRNCAGISADAGPRPSEVSGT